MILFVSAYFGYFNLIFDFISAPLHGIDISDPTNWGWHILDGLLWVVRHLVRVLFFIIALVLLMVGVYFLSSLVNSPFYEAMADKVLFLHDKKEEQPFKMKEFFSDLVHSLKIELFKMLLFLSISVGLFVLNLIPGIGVIFAFLGFLYTSWVFAFGLSSYPMVSEKRRFSEMVKWGRQNKMGLIGFGLPAMIPIFGLLIMNFQVVGGTLFFIEFTHEN